MTSRDRIASREWWLLAAATIAGAVLRIVAIGREALWGDEALTYVLAQAPAQALARAPIDPTAPLYYWLHQLLIPDGASAAAGRSIALVAGVLAIPAAFFLARQLVGRGAWLVAAWVAVSAPLVDYSQEARAYALLVLLILLSALALHRALDPAARRRGWLLATFVVTTLLALYTHFVALFWAAPALLILVVESKRSGDRRRAVGAYLASAVVLIAFVPELQRAWRYATENNAFHWLEQPGPDGFVKLVASLWFPFGPLAFSAIAAALLVLLAAWQRRSIAQWARCDPAAALILAALLLQPLGLWLFGFLVSPVIMPRTLLPSLPAVGLLIALFLQPLGARARLACGTAVIAAALAATLITGPVRRKEPWGAARAVLARADMASDLILACPLWKAPALMAATRGLAVAPLATRLGGRLVLIEPRMGTEPRWERLFYERAYRAVLARPMGVEPPVETATAVSVRSLTLVSSECEAEERAALAEQVGPFTIAQRWTGAAPPGHAGITIERWVLDRPRSIALSVAR